MPTTTKDDYEYGSDEDEYAVVNNDTRDDPKSSQLVGALFCQIVILVLIISLLFYTTFQYSLEEFNLLSYHAVSGIIATMGCTPCGAMTLSYYSITKFKLARQGRLYLHIILQLLSFILMVTGYICIHISKFRNNFITLHASFGITTIVLHFLTMLIGLTAYNALRLNQLVKAIKMVYSKALHNTISLFTITFQLITLLSGFNTYDFLKIVTNNGQVICLLCAIIIYLFSNISGVRSAFFRLRRICG